MVSLIAAPFYAFPAQAEEEFNYILPAYDGNTIVEGVAYANNIPTTDEEIAQARAYDAEQKRIAEQKRLAALKKASLAANSGFNLCSCVIAINQKYGTNIHTLNGYARSIPVSSNLPSTTGFVVTYESWAGHIAHYYLDGEFIVIDWEANYQSCKITSGRKLLIGSPLIKGYL